MGQRVIIQPEAFLPESSHRNVIDIAFISLNVPYMKPTRLRNLFYQIKYFTSFRQCRKNQYKGMNSVIRDDRPKRRDGNILRMYQLRFCSGYMIDEERGFPNPDQRVVKRIIERAMHIYIRIVQDSRIDRRENAVLNVRFYFVWSFFDRQFF